MVTHDINKEISENKEENLTSDENGVVLQEVIKEESPEDPLEDQVKEDVKPIESMMAFPKLLMCKSSLKNILSLGKCCHPKFSVTTTNTEESPTQWTAYEETQMRRIMPKANVSTSKSLTDTDSCF